MPKVYVYDSYDNKFFRYTLRENDPMPYSTDTTLRVREFRGSSKSNVLWTTTAAILSRYALMVLLNCSDTFIVYHF